MIERTITSLEEAWFGGPTWATQEMSLGARLRFYRDTAIWPGQYSQETTAMGLGADIASELRQRKLFCVKQKLRRAREAGLDVVAYI